LADDPLLPLLPGPGIIVVAGRRQTVPEHQRILYVFDALVRSEVGLAATGDRLRSSGHDVSNAGHFPYSTQAEPRQTDGLFVQGVDPQVLDKRFQPKKPAELVHAVDFVLAGRACRPVLALQLDEELAF